MHVFVPLIDAGFHFVFDMVKFGAVVGMVMSTLGDMVGFFFTDAAVGEFL